MFSQSKSDINTWANYHNTVHPAEAVRLAELVPDPVLQAAYIDFGLRPVSRMDIDPFNQPTRLEAPWAPAYEDLHPDPILADIATGCKFIVEPESDRLIFDIERSDNWLEGQETLSKASFRNNNCNFHFHKYNVIAKYRGAKDYRDFSFVKPLELRARDRQELEQHISSLHDLFCGRLSGKRLWLRGQRCEYALPRDNGLSMRLYGQPLPSLTPSIERYARANPDKMNFGLVWHGPNHWWKKPFLIWLMRQNAHWFTSDNQLLTHLDSILRSDDDKLFAELLVKIQFSPMPIGNPPHLEWPDEADDLRQWFFANMKRLEFGITLQQYGYYTSLLDLTEDIDVALYFTQAHMRDGSIRCEAPKAGRVIYVFVQSLGDFYFHGSELFWGTDGWSIAQPPRLNRQKAGFILGSTNRTQNFYGTMIAAKIFLADEELTTTVEDSYLFPPETEDLLFSTLKSSRPHLEGLY